MSVTIACVNDRASAGIRISAGWEGQLTPLIKKAALRRYLTGEEGYKVLYTKDVELADDMIYEYVDTEPIAGVSYTYEVCALIEGDIGISMESQEIVCRFEGVMLSDSRGSWHSAFGTSDTRFTLNAQKNRPVNYIVTLSGKFPHRVSNSKANYWTGSCSALWLPWKQWQDDLGNIVCEEPSMENADAYRLAFIEWLMTDEEKYMKTEDGKAMMIAVDGNPQESYNPIAGLTTVSFEWTQTGEAPRG